MLRFFYICFDVLAFILGLLAPVAVFHWLGRITLSGAKYKLVYPYVAFLNPLFDPINTVFTALFHPPAIHFNGQSIPPEQGIQALLLTFGFLGFNFLAEFLKTTEQRLDVAKHAEIHRLRLQRLKEEESKNLQKAVVNRRFLVFVEYDFSKCQVGTDLIEAGLIRFEAQVLQREAGGLLLEFPVLNKAITFCKEVNINILKYYNTLRPMDPQPTFKISLAAPSKEVPVQQSSLETKQIAQYAAQNQVILTLDIRDGLEKDGLSQAHHCQSLGMYRISNSQLELFKLLNRNPSKDI